MRLFVDKWHLFFKKQGGRRERRLGMARARGLLPKSWQSASQGLMIVFPREGDQLRTSKRSLLFGVRKFGIS
jgi:hypothetical protein